MGARFAVRPRGGSGDAEAVYEFDQGRIVIGRGQGADVRLPHPSVSQAHAVVRQEGVGYVLVDEGSTNGTWVGGQAVVPGRPKALRNGDRIDVGTFELRFESGVAVTAGTSAEQTAALARRFVREVWSDPGEASMARRLVVTQGPDEGATLELPAPPARLLIGRDETCELHLSDADVSREHAEVTVDLDGVSVADLESKNGIAVNDRRVTERRLRDRDELGLGGTVLRLDDPADDRLRALDDQEDEPMAPPEPPATADEPEPAIAAGPTDGTGAPAPAPPPARPSQPRLGADLVIYLLAGSVLALSLVGLFLLLRG